MSMNLVEGGARRGLFTTRRQRLVRVLEPFQFSEPPVPGKAPEARTCWKGMRFMADGKTQDGELIWEQSGAVKSTNGAPNQPDDLVSIVSLEPQVSEYLPGLPAPQVDNRAMETEIAERDSRIEHLQKQLEQKIQLAASHEDTIARQDAALVERNATIADLQKQLAEALKPPPAKPATATK